MPVNLNLVSRLTDQQLVALALQDDERAFAELVDRYRAKVFSVVSRILGESDTADSAAHEAFIRAFRSLVRYKPEYSFSGWLARIARNAAIDRVQKRKVDKLAIEGSACADTDEFLDPRLIALQVPAESASPLQRVLSKEKVEQFRHALTYLKPRHREAILLHLEQLSDQEVADRMGVPVNTVRSYLKRGKDHLTKIMLEMREESTSRQRL
jgi:RNA polymerase sigma factor (sigma-70 family)